MGGAPGLLARNGRCVLGNAGELTSSRKWNTQQSSSHMRAAPMTSDLTMMLSAALIVCSAWFGGGCAAKPAIPQKTRMVDFWLGTNHYIMTRTRYCHEILIVPDYEAGEPNAKLEVIGELK
jgi:hypothetical protein